MDPRERILSTAYALFMTYGLSTVGVDRVVAEAGVAKDTWFHRHDFEGCLFINSLLETHAQSSPVRSATTAGMTRVRGVVLELAHEAGADDPEGLARALHMLITGSIIGAEQGDLDSAREAKEVAGLVLERAGVASGRDALP